MVAAIKGNCCNEGAVCWYSVPIKPSVGDCFFSTKLVALNFFKNSVEEAIGGEQYSLTVRCQMLLLDETNK